MSLLEDAKTFSVQIRLCRTTIEYGYVDVEITPDLIGLDGKLDSEGLFRRPSNGGKNRKWFGTGRNISSSLIRFNSSESRTKRVCSKVKTDLNRSESPWRFGRVLIKATDIVASNEITGVGGQRSAVPTSVGWAWNPSPAD
jgi:hypothetical protein